MLLAERLARPGPKRILALDGGGTRGVVSLAFLREVERALCGDGGEGRLADHFDLIGGTSTGAIIAAGLALGWRVDDILERYLRFAGEIFRPRWQRWLMMSRYRAEPLESLLAATLRPPGTAADAADILLGGRELRTGLAVVTKRVDTGSVWVVSNLPGAPHYADRHGQANGNARIPLRNLVRASAAAPMFFEPAEFELGPRLDGTAQRGRFVDGGVSPYNNPSLRLLELARLPVFGLRWRAGRDRLMVVSVGTGRFRPREAPLPRFHAAPRGWIARMPSRLPLLQAVHVLRSTITDGELHSLRSLLALGWSPQRIQVDGEVGSLSEGGLADAPLFTALRYDLDFDAMARAGTLAADEVRALHEFDAPDNMARLHAMAAEAAAREVVPGHLRFQTDAPEQVIRPPAP